ncbi:MAG: glycoside hydrolase family 13 protein [Ruminococcaceae bacterium]|nr:glycoside hydrolase family 13 protein [Oscillospiraceae bacterium]
MDFSKIISIDLVNAHGKIEYSHNGKISARRVFSKNSSSKILLYIPRSVSASSVYINFYSESCDSLIFTKQLEWRELVGDFDLYSLDFPACDIDVGLYFFNFKIESVNDCIYAHKIGQNVFFSRSEEKKSFFQLTVCDFNREYLSKLYGGVIYHVFVDRFNKGGRGCFKKGEISYDNWDYIPEYPEYPGAHLKNNSFYGGTLDGIRNKLDYISSLGVTKLYLSPIFESPSNHKYDTSDYMSVDSAFGGDEALVDLINDAKQKNIDIILDGVFNHTGADSIYFDKYSKYSTLGAYESKNSPYFDWYDFKSYPDDYTCWWGIEILPRINPSVKTCGDYFTKENGVIDKYSKMGISGLRLDVADELSDNFIYQIKNRLLSNNPNSILYGEVWEDASNKIAYETRKKYYLGNELDGVMNYPLRDGIIDYLKNKETQKLNYALTEIIYNAPLEISNLQMNLLGTHDTERIITVLGGESSKGRSNDYLCKKRMNDSEKEKAKFLLKLAYTILATVPGIPSVFYGDEVGLEGYHDPFNRMPYPWGFEDVELLSFYRKIGSLRKTESVYKIGEFKLLHLDKELLVFQRKQGKTKYLTVINIGVKTLYISGEEKIKDILDDCGFYSTKAISIEPYHPYILKTSSKNIYIF